MDFEDRLNEWGANTFDADVLSAPAPTAAPTKPAAPAVKPRNTGTVPPPPANIPGVAQLNAPPVESIPPGLVDEIARNPPPGLPMPDEARAQLNAPPMPELGLNGFSIPPDPIDMSVAPSAPTPEHLGMFDSADAANTYAQTLHEQQAVEYGDKNKAPLLDDDIFTTEDTEYLTTPSAKPEPDFYEETKKNWSAFVDMHKHAYKAGEVQLSQAMIYNQVLNGTMSVERAKQLSDKLANATNSDEIMETVNLFDPRNASIIAANSMPQMIATVQHGTIAGGAAGFTAGAAGGAWLGPGSGLTGAAGAGFGATLGTFYASYEIMKGSTYKEFIDAGLPADNPLVKETARVVAGVSAGIEIMQLGQVNKMFGKGFRELLKSDASKAVKEAFTKLPELRHFLLENVAIQSVEEGSQQVAEELGKIVLNAALQTGVVPDMSEVAMRVAASMAAGAYAGGVLGAAGKFTGNTAGAVFNKVADHYVEAAKYKESVLNKESQRQAMIDQNVEAVKEVQARMLTNETDKRAINLEAKPAEEVLSELPDVETAKARVKDLSDTVADLREQKKAGEDVSEDLKQANKQLREAKAQRREAEALALMQDIRKSKDPTSESSTSKDIQDALNALPSIEETNARVKDLTTRVKDLNTRKKNGENVSAELKQAAKDLREAKATQADTQPLVLKMALRQAVDETKNDLRQTIKDELPTVDKKMETLVKQRDNIEKKINKLEAEISKDDDPYKVTPEQVKRQQTLDQLIEKWSVLDDTISRDELTTDKINKAVKAIDLLDRIGFAADDGTLSAGVMNELRSAINNGRIPDVDKKLKNLLQQTAKDATKAKDQNLETSVKNLKKVVNLALTKDQRKDLPILPSVKTPGAVNKALDAYVQKISDILNKEAKTEAQAKLTKTVKLGQPRRSTVTNTKKSKFNNDTNAQSIFVETKKQLGMSKKNLAAHQAKAFSEYVSAMLDKDGSGPTVEQMTRFEVSKLLSNIHNKDAFEIDAIANALEQIRKDGLAAKETKRMADVKYAEDITTQVVDAIINGEEFKAHKPTKVTKNWFAALGKVATDAADFATFSWENLWRKALINIKDRATLDKLVDKLQAHHIAENVRTLRRKMRKNLYSNIASALDMTETQAMDTVLRYGNERVSFEYDNGFYEGTKGELMQLVAWSKSKKLQEGLEKGNGYTLKGDDSWLSNAQKLLTDKDRAVMDAVEKTYTEHVPALAQAFNNVTGLDLAVEDFYGGHVRRTAAGRSDTAIDVDINLDDFEQQMFGSSKQIIGLEGTSFVQERTGGDKPILEVDMFDNALKTNDAVARYVAWAPHMNFFRRVMTNANMSRAMNQYTPGLHASLMVHYEDMMKGPRTTNNFGLGTLSSLARENISALLMLRPLDLVRQYSSIVNVARKIPHQDFINGVMDYYADLEKADAVIEATDYWQNRYDDPISTLEGLWRRKTPAGRRVDNIKSSFLSALILGDQEVTRAGWWAVYNYHLKNTKGDVEYALKQANLAIDTTQSTSNEAEVSAVGRRSESALLIAFGQQPTRLGQDESLAWARAFKHKDADSVMRAIGMSVINRLSTLLFVAPAAAWTYAMATSQKERDDAMFDWLAMTAVGSTVPIASEIMAAGAAIAAGKQAYEPKMLLTKSVYSSIEFSAKASKYAIDGTLDQHMAELFYLYATGPNLLPKPLGFGLPLPSIAREVRRADQGKGSALDLVNK